MSTSAPVPKDHPLMIAWEKYKATEDFANTRRWASQAQHVDGSLWAAFMAGFTVATERAGSLAESIDNASDDERVHNVPGCGAMGAVINYRDEIRKGLFK